MSDCEAIGRLREEPVRLGGRVGLMPNPIDGAALPRRGV
jgi:hypothetical protein